MSKYPKLSHFVSEIDQFLQEFDRTHPQLSAAQQFERQKAQRIARLRDYAETTQKTQTLWEEF